MPYKEFEIFHKKTGFVPQLLESIKDTDPEMFETISRLDDVILKDGALSEKQKRIIAMCLSAQQQCSKCVDTHAKAALYLGATKQEIMEALFVCLLVGGAPCLSAARRTIAFLRGQIDPLEFAGE
ncbi:putative 4-carboxymuconolactone decarboxylase [Methanocella conradii HZ254]|uniref:4-carboxymuconolactone decarboxylase n=1 Tax=Methanocella conradii (strain DSM 24694 / JCM 17849 / CGMCC 1.5162 / HZ254) TaxID=1041930 RepID=H8I727_METCZ|nr:carboxymuconolactone decarboxylase family protein [Methanocella conradii]AFD00278.1 putative 4-carboxymuconolactone decarboxylase [Methanocella conradii HZ254]